ncbi:hypothetical protein J6590_105637 [Homalodisca vitripennis]|nr:hypothetical protein J6590_105637 [Homalodisca vitripennis]
MRKIKADKKAEEVTKAATVAARIKKRKLEDMEEEEEELYGPGIDAIVRKKTIFSFRFVSRKLQILNFSIVHARKVAI